MIYAGAQLIFFSPIADIFIILENVLLQMSTPKELKEASNADDSHITECIIH